ncbi:hypothetical protein EVAR_14863_1 [Eumeta japonica]|uniref:Uncharacterized protein n=1 Tax=Eumeta variegata TaxID=151549 RepID=A0A4C1V4H3_EUMVA|nr:hypothetical protein EVAR_14863_1 [Eumeta japonica]
MFHWPPIRQGKSSRKRYIARNLTCELADSVKDFADNCHDTLSGRTCSPDALDNLVSRECDRYREHLRQLIMTSRLRPMPTGGHTAPRPPRTCETQWYGCPSRSTDAECGRRCAPITLRTVRRLPGRRGELFLTPRRSERYGGSGSLMRVAMTAAVGCVDSLISGWRRARLDLRGPDHRCVLS